MTPRMRHLLSKAARAYEEGRNSFNYNWLEENKVTGDECYSLNQLISSAIDLLLAGDGF